MTKTFSPTLQKLRGPNPDAGRVQDSVATAFDGLRSGIADGLLATGVVVPAAGGSIQNPLGRKAQGMILVAANCACQVTLISSTENTAVVQVSLGVISVLNPLTKRWVIIDVAQPLNGSLLAPFWG